MANMSVTKIFQDEAKICPVIFYLGVQVCVCVCVCVCACACAQCLKRPEERGRAEVAGSSECWKLNSGLLQEQQVFLTRELLLQC